MIPIDLTSERLYFKRLTPNYASEEYLRWLNDKEVNKYLETKGCDSLQLLESYIQQQYDNNVLFWAICLKNSNKHIGNIKIDPINKINNSGEYGILMGDKNEWGKGYAKEASLRIIEYCFNELNLEKITLGVIEQNKNAVSLYNKLGFVTESKKINAGYYDNELCNLLRMFINAKEFNK